MAANEFGECKPSHKPTWVKSFPVVGQGVIIFNMVRKSPFCIFVSPKLKKGVQGADEWISLTVDENSATFRERHNGETKVLKRVSTIAKQGDYSQPVGIDSEHKIAYWLSYNRDLLQLKYGRGYVMSQTTCLGYDYIGEPGSLPESQEESIREDYKYLFSPTIRRTIELYDQLPKAKLIKSYAAKIIAAGPEEYFRMASIVAGSFGKQQHDQKVRKDDAKQLACTLIDVEQQVQLMSSPFVTNWSPIVKDSKTLTLDDLDSDKFTFSSSLPDVCQELYNNVVSCTLDSPNDPYPLSDAIEYSINTEGMTLNTTLKNKDEFDDKTQIYLRVTLGPDRGKSAGIPYVLEIWPKQCGSPIHNHGNCYAVINVIHGAIDIEVYNKQTSDTNAKHIMKFTAHKGQQTWISPNWFQTHKLWNSTPTYTATIQCYQYSKADTTNWPYFDYVSDDNTIDEFLPNSDFKFNEMKKIVMQEYVDYVKGCTNKGNC